MKEFSLKYLRCIKCGSNLELDKIKQNLEIDEGFLRCKKCNLVFPIIEKIPIIWDDFSSYLLSRRMLGGKLVKFVSPKMKSFVKKALTKNSKRIEDRTKLEERWTGIYQNNQKSRFYSVIKQKLTKIPTSMMVLEYGCSIGIISSFLADSHPMVFGVDRSFSAIKEAKKNSKENLDYFVADSLSPIFGNTHFDLVVALNLLELVEPEDFLKKINSQIKKGYLVVSDPYDYDRGQNSVKKPLYEESLRLKLENMKFQIIQNTKNPSYFSWNLKINQRTTLNYKVDYVVAKK